LPRHEVAEYPGHEIGTKDAENAEPERVIAISSLSLLRNVDQTITGRSLVVVEAAERAECAPSKRSEKIEAIFSFFWI